MAGCCLAGASWAIEGGVPCCRGRTGRAPAGAFHYRWCDFVTFDAIGRVRLLSIVRTYGLFEYPLDLSSFLFYHISF